jgi:hypothetical protein
MPFDENKYNRYPYQFCDGGEAAKQETPGDDTPATDTAETGATEPSKVKLPDGRELTAEEIAEAIEIKANKAKWEKSLNEKGHELNERLRSLPDQSGEVQGLKQQLAELQRSVKEAQFRQPEDDWEHEEDPDRRQAKFFKSTSNQINRIVQRIDQVEQKQTADAQSRKEQEVLQYWDSVYSNACVESSIQGNQKANDFIKTYVKGKMVEVGGANWKPDEIRQWAKDAKEYIVSAKQDGVNEWSKKKVEEKDKIKPTPAGGTPAPQAGKKIKPGMSVQQQIDVMAADPNLQ